MLNRLLSFYRARGEPSENNTENYPNDLVNEAKNLKGLIEIELDKSSK